MIALMNARMILDRCFAAGWGPAEIASEVGLSEVSVRCWRHRNSIPARHDAPLVAAARARGIPLSHEQLALTRATRRAEA